jgi:vacuolar-type H+-ATPase subunit E/Vma4
VQGIERIKQHILANADATVKTIQEDAAAFEKKTLAESEERCRNILQDAEENARRDAAMTVRRGESLADAEKRKNRLAHRQNIAEAVISRALNLLTEEPEERRVERYASWVRVLGVNEGVITLSEREQHLERPLAAALASETFAFSKQGGSFSGGIVIQHGRVTDNLTYDLAVRDHRPELTRLIFEMLGGDLVAEEESDDA